MKKILLLTCVLALLTTSGCLFAEGGRHGHGRNEDSSAAIDPAPEILLPVVPAARVHY
jgi:hypothetical protein